MRILHTVQRYAPDTGGSEEVVKQLSEYLVSFGHEVTVATSSTKKRNFSELNGVRIVEFNCSGNRVEGINGESNEYRDFIANFDGDVVMNYAAQIWSSDLLIDLLPSLRMKKIFVPCGFSQLHNPTYREYFENMPEVLKRYHRVVYLSDRYIDRECADRWGMNNSITIPNGASIREFTDARPGAFRERYGLGDRTIVLNVSNHSRLKNHAFFWNCIDELNDRTVAPVLIGNAYVDGPSRWLRQCYVQCRWNGLRRRVPVLENLPRHEVVEAFVDADVFLFGSMVECSPLVMFEAFAGRALFITTNVGNVSDHENIACIVSDEHEAIGVLKKYMRNPDEFRQRIEMGHRLVHDELNWERIARRFEQLYESS